MKSFLERKCHHCKALYVADRRNLHHQRYCSEPACRTRSKAESQRRWRQKPQNQNYFRGQENSERVREWRQGHPGYWRKKTSAPEGPLQEICPTQVPRPEPVARTDVSGPLQDFCMTQRAFVVGLISTITGSALQEDIAATARALLRKGQDILGPHSAAPSAADSS
jgi:hypothetical protein